MTDSSMPLRHWLEREARFRSSVSTRGAETKVIATADAETTGTTRSTERTATRNHATITVLGGTDEILHDLLDRMGELERHWSLSGQSSEICRLNRAAGAPTTVSAATVRLIQAIIDGVAVAPDRREPIVDEGETDLGGVQIDGSVITVPRGATVDPRHVGRALAADLVCELAMGRGAHGVMVEIGGITVVAGQSPDGIAWRVTNFNPVTRREPEAALSLARGAVVSSGDGTRTVSVIAATGAKAASLAVHGFRGSIPEYLAWLPTVGAAGLVTEANGDSTESANWDRYR